MLNLKGVNSG